MSLALVKLRTRGKVRGLQPLSLSVPLRYNTAGTASFIGATPGSTLKIITNLSPVDQYGGLTIDSTARAVSGVPAVRSFLVRETLGQSKRDTLFFAPEIRTRTMKLGMNVAGLVRYSPNDQFLDYFKCSEIETYPATMDSNGMPLTLKPGQYGGFRAAYLLPMPDGRPVSEGGEGPVKMRLITDGDFDAEMLSIAADGYGGAGQPTTQLVKEGNDLVITWTTAGAGKVNAYLIIKSDTAQLRSVPTYMGFVRDTEAALYRAGKICRPGFVTDMAGFAYIRWLNQSDANLLDPCPTPDEYITYASQGDVKVGDYTPRRVSLKKQVDICRELGIGGWFHEHCTVTDAQALANNVQYDRMRAAGLTVRKELANEIWNSQFAQYAYGQQRAVELGYVVGSPPDHNSYEGATWWTGYRVAQLAAQDRGKGYRWMIGGQPANPSQTDRVFQGFAAAGGQLTDLYAVTTANYMTGTSNRSDGISTAQFNEQLNWVATDNDAGALDNVLNFAIGSATANIALHAQVIAKAAARGLPVECYEGTSAHLNSAGGDGAVIGYTGYDSFLLTVPDSPLYEGAVNQNLEIGDALGFKSSTVFDYNSKPTSSVFGRFGIRSTPGWLAVRAWLAAGGAAQ